jgi:hypothetical protein
MLWVKIKVREETAEIRRNSLVLKFRILKKVVPTLKVLALLNPRTGNLKIYTSFLSIRYCAICTALVAAPFLKLSATIHIFNVLG